MQNWQKQIINQNLHELLSCTTLNDELIAILKAKGLLSLGDIQKIKSKDTNISRAFELYQILETRAESYDLLRLALQITRQTGALQILDQTYVSDSEDDEDEIKSDSGAASSNNSKCEIIFSKCVDRLEHYIDPESPYKLVIISSIDPELTINKLKNTLTFTYCNRIKVDEISFWSQLRNYFKGLICTMKASNGNVLYVLYEKEVTMDPQEDIATKVKECISKFEQRKIGKNVKIIIVTSTRMQDIQVYINEQSCTAKIKVTEDKFKWEQIKKAKQRKLLKQKVLAFGELSTLEMVCSSLINNNKNQFMREFLHGKLLIDLLKQKSDKDAPVPVVFHGTIPTVDKQIYISRAIRCRNHVSKNIFSYQSKSEIFTFFGVNSLEDLAQFTGNRNVVLSWAKNYIDANQQTKARFLLLEQESDFEQICKKATLAKLTVHKIEIIRESKVMRWVETQGSDREVLQMNILEQSKQAEIQEENILEECSRNNPASPVIISGSCGMGKSFLLASLAAKAQDQTATRRIVLFVNTKDFLDAVGQSSQNNDAGESKSENKLHQILLKELSSRITPYDLEKNILLEPSEFAPKVYVFFDGLDDVPAANQKLAFLCFDLMKNSFNGTKLYIAASPNLLLELERLLGLPGYNIEPFNDEDQMQFFKKYWSVNLREKKNEKELVIYTEKFQKKLIKNLPKNEKHIAIVLLHCSLIAEMFAKEATEGNVEPSCKFTSIADLYEQIVNRKFESFKHTDIILKNQIYQPVHLEDLHAYLSIQSIFVDTEWPEKLRSSFLTGNLFNSLTNMFAWNVTWENFEKWQIPNDHLVKIGLVECDKKAGNLKFIHQTFAEYFLAKFISRNLYTVTPTIPKEDLVKFVDFANQGVLETLGSKTLVSKHHPFFPDIFRFKLPVVCNFISDMLLPSNVQTSEFEVVAASLNYEKILHACIHDNCPKLLQLYFGYFKNNNGLAKTMLQLAASYSTPNILKLLCCVLQPVEIHPPSLPHLHSGCVQSVLRTWSSKEFRSLIIACLANTRNSDDTNVFERRNVLDFLEKNNLVQLKASLKNHLMKIMRFSYRPELLLHLMSIILSNKQEETERINLLEEIDSDQRTVLHKAAELFSQSQYIEFLKNLKKHQDAIMKDLCMLKDAYQQTPFHYLVRFIEPTLEICKIFAEYKTDFNNQDKSDFNVTATAIKSGRSLECINYLINNVGQREKVNVNGYGHSLLHIAAQYSTNVNLFEMLLASGLNINLPDIFGNTPVFYAIRNASVNAITTIEFFHCREANLEHRNQQGETILHWASESGNAKVIELLFRWGQFMSSPVDNSGNTAMHWALRANVGEKLETIKLLHETFPDDVNSENKMNQCPLTYGLQARHPDICAKVIEYLLPNVRTWTTTLTDLTIAYLNKISAEGESTVCESLIETIKARFANV